MNTSIAISGAVTLLVDPFAGSLSAQPIVFDEIVAEAVDHQYADDQTLSIVQDYSGNPTSESENRVWHLDHDEQEIMHQALLNSTELVDGGQLL